MTPGSAAARRTTLGWGTAQPPSQCTVSGTGPVRLAVSGDGSAQAARLECRARHYGRSRVGRGGTPRPGAKRNRVAEWECRAVTHPVAVVALPGPVRVAPP